MRDLNNGNAIDTANTMHTVQITDTVITMDSILTGNTPNNNAEPLNKRYCKWQVDFEHRWHQSWCK